MLTPRPRPFVSATPQNEPARPPQIQDADIAKLYHHYTALDRHPNIITRERFRPFEALFRVDHGLDEDAVHALTQRFCAVIDLYKETQIIESANNPKVLLTLPPMLTPVRAIPNTPNNDAIVTRNERMNGHQVPKYAAEAFSAMVSLLVSAQAGNKQTITEQQRKYLAGLQNYTSVYGKPPAKSTEVPATTEPAPAPTTTHLEWEEDD